MLNERELTKQELEKREDAIMDLKTNKRSFVKRYGKDAEKVMYGRATNMAKKKTENMNNDKVREMIKDSLKNPKAADLNKDGKISDYEETRGAAIEKNLDESSSTEEKRIAKMAIKKLAKYRGVSEDEARQDLIRAANELGDLKENYYPSVRAYNVIDGDRNIVYKNLPLHIAIEKAGEREDYKYTATDSLAEDLDLGHEDNEPHMLKADLYRIGKYAMELYQMMDEFEGKGEVDLPHWWQSKIINAKSNLVGAKHYLDFEAKELAIDAVVNRISDVAPEMEIDDESMMENIGKDEILAGKIAKALKDMVNKDASSQHNLKQARIALNKGDMDAAKKIAKPYIDGVNEATRTYWHVIEDVDGEKGHQGVYNTKEEAEKRADSLQDMFPRSFFYVEASNSKKEPVDITLEESKPKSIAEKLAKQLKSK